MNSPERIAALRKEYTRAALSEKDVHGDPFEQFRAWFTEARNADLLEPTGLALATSDAAGQPSLRMVLMKGLDDRGFIFFTNYESRKALALEQNPRAALLFYWAELERQVRIEGTVERLAGPESSEYFAARPRESQLSAWASPQSRVVADRLTLERGMDRLRASHDGQEIPRPPFWGGFRCVPSMLEFWQGRPGRLHDRIRFRREADRWMIERIAP